MAQLLEFLQTHEEAFRSRARLASLYSDFRFQRATNPDGYIANCTAWLNALTSATNAGIIPSQSGDRYVLHTGEQLTRALQTQELGRPLALSAVVDNAVQKKALITLKDFLEAKGSVYSRNWVPSPWQVMQWGLRQLGVLGSRGNDERLPEGKLVIMANVEAASNAVIDAVAKTATSNSSRIFSRDLFLQTFAPALGVDSLNPTDLDVLLTHLSRDRAAISYSPSTGTIKFASPSEANPAPITQEDISIASLRSLISSLNSQVSVLAAKFADLDSAARDAVAHKRLTAAKTALRQKRQTDTTLQQRSAALAQLEAVYAQIEQAADQVEMVQVLRTAGQTLKTLNAKTGGVEAVQDLVEGLREEMGTVEEISAVINEVGVAEIDEGNVEEELERMESVEREKNAAKESAQKAKTEQSEVDEVTRKLAELDGLGVPQGEISGEKEIEKEAEQDTA